MYNRGLSLHSPELLVPGRKPQGLVRVRQGGPHISWLFRHREYWRDMEGLVPYPTVVGSPTLKSTGYNAPASGTPYLNYGDDVICRNWTGAFTYITRARGESDGDSDFPNLAGNWISNDDTGVAFGPDTVGRAYFRVGKAVDEFVEAFEPSGYPYAHNEDYWVNCAYRYTPSTEISIHTRDAGILAQNTSSIGSSVYTDTASGFIIGAAGEGQSPGFVGDIEFVLWWPEALSDERIQQILADPYGECFEPFLPFVGLTPGIEVDGGAASIEFTAHGIFQAPESVAHTDSDVSVEFTGEGAALISAAATNNAIASMEFGALGTGVTGVVVADGSASITMGAVGSHAISVLQDVDENSIVFSAHGDPVISVGVDDGVASMVMESAGTHAISVSVADGTSSITFGPVGDHVISVANDGTVSMVMDAVGSVLINCPTEMTFSAEGVVSIANGAMATAAVRNNRQIVFVLSDL